MNALDDLAVQAAGDAAAFSALYDHCYSSVFTYVRYRVDDDATADELCAQVFERMMANLHTYTPGRASFKTWLFAIARNALNDHWRRQKLRRFIPLDSLLQRADPQPTPEEQAIFDEETRRVLHAMRTLDERERDMLGLKFAAGLNNRQIAAITGLKDSHVGVLLYRAINKLRAACQVSEPEPTFIDRKDMNNERA